jgi:hypothetical protein
MVGHELKIRLSGDGHYPGEGDMRKINEDT